MSKYAILRKPPLLVTRRRPIFIPRERIVMHASIVEYSEIMGKGLTLFVFFTATLNWLHYREMRKSMEAEAEAEAEQKKSDKNKK